MKKKLGLVFLAALLAFAIVACQPEVFDGDLSYDEIGVEGPRLRDLEGTWTGTQVAQEYTVTTSVWTLPAANADLSAPNIKQDDTTQKVTMTEWVANLEIGEQESRREAAPFTFTLTERLIVPGGGVLAGSITANPAATTTSVTKVTYDVPAAAGDSAFGSSGSGEVVSRSNQVGNTFSTTGAGNFNGVAKTEAQMDADRATIRAGLFDPGAVVSYGQEVKSGTTAGQLTTLSGFPDVLQVRTVTGYVYDIETYNRTYTDDVGGGDEGRFGREFGNHKDGGFVFVLEGGSNVTHALKQNDAAAPATANSVVVEVTTEQVDPDMALVDKEGFIWDEVRREWVLIEFSGLNFTRAAGLGLRLAEED